MGIGFGRPPALVGVAGDPAWVERARASVGEGVVRTALVPPRSLVALGQPVEARLVGVAQFLPDPPTVRGPYPVHVAVAVPEQDQLGGRLHHAPPAKVVLIPGRPAEGRLGTTREPVDVDRPQAAGDLDLPGHELPQYPRAGPRGRTGLGAGVDLDLLGRAVVDLRIEANVGVQIRSPAGFSVGESGLNGRETVGVVVGVQVEGHP